MATALELLQEILDRLCVEKQISYIDVGDDTQRQMLALLNEEGREQAASFDWQQLIMESNAEASDDDNKISDQGLIEERCPGYKRICNNTIYLDGRVWPLVGPLSISGRAYTKAGGMSFVDGYYIQNGHLYLTGPTNSGQNIRITYVSKYWATDAEGNGLEKMSVDTDRPLIDDRLLVLGVVWRWLSRNGLPYQQEWLNYNNCLIQNRASDRTHDVLSASDSNRKYSPLRSLIGGVARPWA